ncbi:MAG TPA: tetratricopeptide repeat protein [Pyrinomonadaceae bacterium]
MPAPEARYCRLCGSPLGSSGGAETDAPISPLARTVPLSNEGRSTNGLAPSDPNHSSSETTRIRHAEMEKLLQRARSLEQASAPARDGHGSATESSDFTAPQTTTLAPRLTEPTRAAAQEEPAAEAEDGADTVETPSLAAAVPAVSPAATPAARQDERPPRAGPRRRWKGIAIAALCVALGGGALAFFLLRRTSPATPATAAEPAPGAQKRLVEEKLSESETWLAAGETGKAVALLRSAAELEPSNPAIHLRLGQALERGGARREAIDEYRISTQYEPGNTTALRALAVAEFDEKLYEDAAESYRRLIEQVGENESDDETRLAYAEALRLAGRTDDARAAYRKISSSASASVAQTARQRLAEMEGTAAPASANTERPRETRPDQPERTPETAATTATPAVAPSPAAQSKPPAGGKTQADADSYYFQALNIVNGRDPKRLSDGELAAALNYFLRAQGGAHAAEARRNADRLFDEHQRRKNK